MPDFPPVRPSHVLAAYAEELVQTRRVVVLGDATSGLADRLLDRGARLVHVYDPEPLRVAEEAARGTQRNVTLAALAEAGASVREGAFDVAIVEDLSAHADPAAVLARVRRLLAPRGVAIVAAPNPEARHRLLFEPGHGASELDYYALYDAVAAAFEEVRMLAQAPFVGYAVAALGEEEDPVPSLDASFLPAGTEEPEWFVALASAEPVAHESFLVVQLPFVEAIPPGRRARVERELERARAEERRAREALARVGAQPADTARAPAPAAHAEVERLQAALRERDAWIVELEKRAAAADTRADAAEGALDDERAARERATGEATTASERERAARTELESLRAQLAAAARARDTLADRARTLEDELSAAKAVAPAAPAEPEPTDDVGRLEEQLVERGRELARLQAELHEAARTGRELLTELELARSGASAPPAAEGAALVDSLSLANARLEADLLAARWAAELAAPGEQQKIRPES
ncbi:MAG: class I SAM-dependent methyltransferase [Polyangiaceae bacterium]|nr:class I SAM-dependent methyltransferase [Polyangiaceae bacterium]